ncbi:MAG: tRNA (adenosine(37)-N6)-dimethylallyltransferase MiaA [Syntrophotaleaceae bacterium]
MPCNLLVILGPTASGKTRLGVAAARQFNGEIISADSRQVFRGMDIGTGKDLVEYGEVPYHLIDIVEAGSEFSVFDFQEHFVAAFEDIRGRGRLPVLVGGTGLYLDAALRGYRLIRVEENPALRAELADLNREALQQRLLELRPEQHNTSDLQDRSRLVRAIEIAIGERDAEPLPLPSIEPLVFGVRFERSALRRRITERLKQRLGEGLIEEVAALHQSGVSYDALEYYGLEYRLVAQHLQGRLNRNDMFQKLNSAIHQFAKRQETWFRRMEKQGVTIHWLDGAGDPVAELLHIATEGACSPKQRADEQLAAARCPLSAAPCRCRPVAHRRKSGDRLPRCGSHPGAGRKLHPARHPGLPGGQPAKPASRNPGAAGGQSAPGQHRR